MLNLVFADYVDPDNILAILASVQKERTAVVLTGRLASPDDNAPIDSGDFRHSVKLACGAAKWYRDFFTALGINLDLFYGGVAPKTLVPHRVHTKESDLFNGFDSATVYQFEGLSALKNLIEDSGGVRILLAGPATGVQYVFDYLFEFVPNLIDQVKEVHAMYGTWGDVELMNLGGDKSRGGKQFNVACHPSAGRWMLDMFKGVPTYLYTTETTRVKEIGFANPQEMRQKVGSSSIVSQAMLNQYDVWYRLAVKPRQEKNPNELLFTHDFCVSLYDDLSIYEWKQVDVVIDDDGVTTFSESNISNIFASKSILKPSVYLSRLRKALA